MSPESARQLVRIAAGCGGTGTELAPFLDLSGVWFSTRTLTLDARTGTVHRRLTEVSSGFVHSAEEPNPGLEAFAASELPALVRSGAGVLVSISGGSVAEIADLGRRLGLLPGVAGVEINLVPTAPDLLQVTTGAEARAVAEAVAAALPAGLLVHAKVGLQHDRPTVLALLEATDALVVSGAPVAKAPQGSFGLLCGPAILPITLARIAAVRAVVGEHPLTAVGGVCTAADVHDLRGEGADAVQIGSALLHDPTRVTTILRALEGAS